MHSLFNPPLAKLPNQIQVISSLNQITLITAPPILVHTLSPLPFFDAKRDGLKTITVGDELGETSQRPIRYLSRSPDGHTVAVVRDGAVEVYKVMKHGSGLQLFRHYKVENGAMVLVFYFGGCFLWRVSRVLDLANRRQCRNLYAVPEYINRPHAGCRQPNHSHDPSNAHKPLPHPAKLWRPHIFGWNHFLLRHCPNSRPAFTQRTQSLHRLYFPTAGKCQTCHHSPCRPYGMGSAREGPAAQRW